MQRFSQFPAGDYNRRFYQRGLGAGTPHTGAHHPGSYALIPGGDLYRCMDALVRNEQTQFLAYGQAAITTAGAITLGIIATTAFSSIVFSIQDHIRRMRISG